MRNLTWFLFFFNLTIQAFAQTDSVTLVNVNWEKRKISKGVTWKTVHFSNNKIFNSNQVINIIEVAPRAKKVKIRFAYSDSLERTSAIAMRRNALAAINGSYFTMRGADPDHQKEPGNVLKASPELNRNRSIVYLRIDNHLIAKQLFSKDSVRKRHQQGVVAISGGQVSVLKADTSTLKWESMLKEHDVLSSGPVLLVSGKKQAIPDDAFCNDRHPRTAVAKKGDGTVLLFVVDGRAKQSSGMSIHELQKTLYWLGCVDAINLDGGGSTTMYIKGQPYQGVVNYPTDNKIFDHAGEREVANVLLLLKN